MMTRFFLIFFLLLLSITPSYAKVKQYPEIEALSKYYKKLTPENSKKIKKILSKYTDDINFQYQLADLYASSGRYLNAETIFKKLLKIQPKDKYEIGLGQALLSQNKFQEILTTIKPKSPIKSFYAYKTFLHAFAYSGIGDFKRSVKTINIALEMMPKNPEFLMLKARSLTALKKPTEALNVIDSIEKTNGLAPILDNIRAENYILTEEFFKALEIYNRAVIIDPENIYVRSARGRVYLLQNKQQKALKEGLFIINNKPSDPMGYFLVASAYVQEKRYEEAFRYMDGFSNRFKNFQEGYLLEAEIQLYNQNNAQAQILLNKYIRMQPNNVKALNLLGVLKLRDGNYYDAINFFKNVQSIDDVDAYSMSALAYAYYKVNNYKAAEFFYQQLKDNFPKYSYVTDDAFQLACNMPTVKKLNPETCQEIKKSEISEQIYDSLAQVHIGNIEAAKKSINQLMKIHPNNVLIKRYYARVLNFTSDHDKAVQALFEVLISDTENHTQSALHELYTIYLSGDSSVDILNKLHTLFLENTSHIDMGYHLANFFYKQKNYTQAILIVDKMIEANPDNIKLFDTAFKIMIKDPSLFTEQITYYLKIYKKNYSGNSQLITNLRGRLMSQNIIDGNFSILAQPFYEKTAYDYKIYAEFLNFIGKKHKASKIFQQSTIKFKDDLPLFLAAFEFYEKQNKLSDIKKISKAFSSNNLDDTTILKAKLLLIKDNKEAAIKLLSEQFDNQKNGKIAKMLLDISPNKDEVLKVVNTFNDIKNNKYVIALKLAEIFITKYKYSLAGKVLYPYYRNHFKDAEYKFLLAQVSFYTDFRFGYKIMKQIIQKNPRNRDYLATMIKFEAHNKNYRQAVILYNQNKPDISRQPDILFYYAYALYKTGHSIEALQILRLLDQAEFKFAEKTSMLKLIDHIENE